MIPPVKTSDAFEQAVSIVLGVEAGYVIDQGGPTRYGITETIARFAGYDGAMINFPLDAAKAIYFNYYWSASHCEKMPWPLSLYVFDAAINQGGGTAIRLLQQTLGIPSDGLPGPYTIDAINNAVDAQTLPARYMAARVRRYMASPYWERDRDGWLKRLFIVAQGVVIA